MKRIIHTSDIHLDANNRFDDTIRIVEDMIEKGAAEAPDLWVVAGDSYPVSVRASLPIERTTLKRLFLMMAESAPVAVIRGNHDLAAHDIEILNDPSAGVHVFTHPDVRPINDIVVGAIPWPSKGYLLSKMPEGSDLSHVDEACRQAMKGILNGMRVAFAPIGQHTDEYPRVLTAHLNVTGADAGGFALVGEDVEVGATDLEETGADYVGLGHIHKHQSFGPRVHFSGSPRRTDFGEEGEERGFLVADIERGQLPDVRFIPTACRPMQTIRIRTDAEPEQVQEGAEVRVIFDLTAAERRQLDGRAWMDRIGADRAHSLKSDFEIRTETRIRSEAIVQAKTDRERLMAYFAQLDPPVSGEEAARLADLAEELEVLQ